MLIDMHVHTTRGSTDSGLDPRELLAEAARLGIDGVCMTEHSGSWGEIELQEAAAETGLALFAGREIETEVGHVIAIGLPRFEAGLHRFQSLVEHARGNGAALILAHPFRYYTDPSPGRTCLATARLGGEVRDASQLAAAIPELAQVDAIETANGATSAADNSLAAQIAEILGMPTTGGSDAHSAQGIGSGLTDMAGRPRTSAELAEAIRAGRTAAVAAGREGTS